MLGNLNILGLIYNSRKVIGWLVGMSVIGSLVWHLVYTFHFKPINELESKVASVEKQLVQCKKRNIKIFNTQNESAFDGYRKRIEEVESEAIVYDEFNSSNYDWMYE